MAPLHVVYDLTATWERDFILRELLGGYPVRLLELSSEQLVEPQSYAGYEELEGHCVLVFSSIASSFDAVRPIVLELKPRVVFHLSDETGTTPEYQTLARDTTLLVRQYHHPTYPSHPNIAHMPLGYMTGMLEAVSTRLTPPPPAQRAFAWSFIGTIKQDRQQMVDTMASLGSHHVGREWPAEMRMRYLDSVFVPNGRGEVGLNCFRLYEASLCGAIPVAVGSDDEINDTFAQEQDPPWIFASSWAEAADQCLELLADEAALYERHRQVLDWWRMRVASVRAEIGRALGPPDVCGSAARPR